MPVGKRVNQTTNKTQNSNNTNAVVVAPTVVSQPAPQQPAPQQPAPAQPVQPTQPAPEKITMTKTELAKLIAEEVAKQSMVTNQNNKKGGKKEMKKQEEPKAVETKRRGRAKKTVETKTYTAEEVAKMLAAKEAEVKAEAPKAAKKAKAKREAEATMSQAYLGMKKKIEDFFTNTNFAVSKNANMHPLKAKHIKKEKMAKLVKFNEEFTIELHSALEKGIITVEMYNSLKALYAQEFKTVFDWYNQMQLAIRTNVRYNVNKDDETIVLTYDTNKPLDIPVVKWHFEIPTFGLDARYNEKECCNDPNTIKELNDDLHTIMSIYEKLVGEKEAAKIKIYEEEDVKKKSTKELCATMLEMATTGILACSLISHFNKVAKAEKDIRHLQMWFAIGVISFTGLYFLCKALIKKAEEEGNNNWLGENGDEEPAPEDSDVDNCYGESDEE